MAVRQVLDLKVLRLILTASLRHFARLTVILSTLFTDAYLAPQVRLGRSDTGTEQQIGAHHKRQC